MNDIPAPETFYFPVSKSGSIFISCGTKLETDCRDRLLKYFHDLGHNRTWDELIEDGFEIKPYTLTEYK